MKEALIKLSKKGYIVIPFNRMFLVQKGNKVVGECKKALDVIQMAETL